MESVTVIWVDLQTAPATVDLSAQVGLFCPIFKIRGVDKVADAIRALTPRAVFFEYDDPSAELLEPLKEFSGGFSRVTIRDDNATTFREFGRLGIASANLGLPSQASRSFLFVIVASTFS